MPLGNITSGLAADRLSLHGDGKAPTNQPRVLPPGLGPTAASRELRAVMVAATLFSRAVGSSRDPYRGNSYELASIRAVGIRNGMSKPGSEPRGTASDEFPTRRVVTVTCKHQTSSGSSHLAPVPG